MRLPKHRAFRRVQEILEGFQNGIPSMTEVYAGKLLNPSFGKETFEATNVTGRVLIHGIKYIQSRDKKNF